MHFKKNVAIFLIVGLLALSFIIAPAPVYAGGGAGFIFAAIVTAIICWACSILVTIILSTVISVATALMTGTQTLLGGLVFGCSGSFDPVFGTCTKKTVFAQQIFTPNKNIRFTNIDIGPQPTPEQFAANPGIADNVSVRWSADAPQGIHEFIVVKDKATGQEYSRIGEGVSCARREQTKVFSLSFGKIYEAEIRYDSCLFIRGGKHTRNVVPLCQDDGRNCGDLSYRGISNSAGTLVKTQFKTSYLPPVAVDLKGNGGDSATVTPGVPIVLSWVSQYARSCNAAGSWSGSKPLSGSETVIPTTGNEVYTLECSRPPLTAQDSISSASSASGFKSSGSEGGGGSEIPLLKEIAP